MRGWKIQRSYKEILSCRNPLMAAAELVWFLWSCTAERSWKTELFFQIEKRLCKQGSFRCSVRNCSLPSRWGEGKKRLILYHPCKDQLAVGWSVCVEYLTWLVTISFVVLFFFSWIKTSNGQCKWEGKILEILFFRSMCRGLGVLLSIGPSAVDGEKQQSKKKITIKIIGWGKDGTNSMGLLIQRCGLEHFEQ